MTADQLSIDQIPFSEDETFEFKSSCLADNRKSFAEKSSAALSGFANSGGGYFIVGIDDKTGLVRWVGLAGLPYMMKLKSKL